MRTPGTIRDIRTGRAIGKTQDLSGTLIDQIGALRLAKRPHYVVAGPCTMLETRTCINLLRKSEVIVIRERQFPPDWLLLFEGMPDELFPAAAAAS